MVASTSWSVPLKAYGRTLADNLFEDITVDTAGEQLKLRLAQGERAELQRLSNNSFRMIWGDALFRAHVPTTLMFELTQKMTPAAFLMMLQRVRIEAKRKL